MKTLLLFLSLFSFLSLALAERGAVTHILGDSQMSANGLGVSIVNTCMNGAQLDDSSEVRLTAAPGGRPYHLLNKELLFSKAQIWHGNFKENSRVAQLTPTGDRYPMSYFEWVTKRSPEVHRVVLFMGINDINTKTGASSVESWKSVADTLKAQGKECIVGLPPLPATLNWYKHNFYKKGGRYDDWIAHIVKYNREASQVLKERGCKILDPSQTLKLGADGQRFRTSDGTHFHPVKDLAQAICQEFHNLPEIENPSPTGLPLLSESQVLNPPEPLQHPKTERADERRRVEFLTPSFIGEKSDAVL